MYKRIILGKEGGKNNCEKSSSVFFLYSCICLMYPTLGSSTTLIFCVFVCVKLLQSCALLQGIFLTQG